VADRDGGTFKLTLEFSDDYPNKPPVVKFVSKVFHPNVYANGALLLVCEICSVVNLCLPVWWFTSSPLCRLHLPRHTSEPVEPDLRHRRHPDLDPVAAQRPQPQLAGANPFDIRRGAGPRIASTYICSLCVANHMTSVSPASASSSFLSACVRACVRACVLSMGA
jgi:hypothetical protein